MVQLVLDTDRALQQQRQRQIERNPELGWCLGLGLRADGAAAPSWWRRVRRAALGLLARRRGQAGALDATDALRAGAEASAVAAE
jgi:hypothetical protein